MTSPYQTVQPTREQVDQLSGAAIVQFGTDWCGFCQAAEPLIEAALTNQPDIQRLKVEDGPGRPLGRSFRVKLWPTLIFLRDGREVARVVRPRSAQEVSTALTQLA
ncbi:MAG TPA: thioredoxin family protein [Polyangiales bacterium]|nr:thioredoxin family protein [Polyangiales bacterium]